MHRIFLAQKRVPKVNLSNFNTEIVNPSCVQHSSGQLPVVFGHKIFKNHFVTASSLSGKEFNRIRKSSNRTDFKNFIHQNIINTANVNTSEAESKTENETTRKKDFNFDALGAWDNRIDLPIMMEASIKHGTPIPMIVPADVGCSSILGKRTYQEDRYVIVELPNNILCCAVFDGHGGKECSEYCAQNLKVRVIPVNIFKRAEVFWPVTFGWQPMVIKAANREVNFP
ncbi:protein phosphatase 1K, mitochondrial-like [Homarus americanus]|uniref:protein phosphatase 1K, mitochondrial-like n=1 Tax=Homarus americanus TaxID=6706 RepID=UPI001C443CDE|nr:protein phosphatase 1K, mitochondrial-like [Homarus americanus]XP_042239969.1 protein phosphatase 1K, mitochondrial-like [Homarus americanus]XP_042239970.1 protein phosphatase 1K, mitochondrial-like [Homarus americanus]